MQLFSLEMIIAHRNWECWKAKIQCMKQCRHAYRYAWMDGCLPLVSSSSVSPVMWPTNTTETVSELCWRKRVRTLRSSWAYAFIFYWTPSITSRLTNSRLGTPVWLMKAVRPWSILVAQWLRECSSHCHYRALLTAMCTYHEELYSQLFRTC